MYKYYIFKICVILFEPFGSKFHDASIKHFYFIFKKILFIFLFERERENEPACVLLCVQAGGGAERVRES